jgi:hypothetical protein
VIVESGWKDEGKFTNPSAVPVRTSKINMVVAGKDERRDFPKSDM